MATRPKRSELSSREDFLIEQFMTMKKLNSIADKLFDLYYIDIDRNSELSAMMRGMVPRYYIDPMNPEHASCYILAGKSSLEYIERLMFVAPYVSEKGKYECDISAWKGLLITPSDFKVKVKNFRKTKLEPMTIMTDRPDGERCPQSIILREEDSKAKDDLVLPFLMLPNRRREGDDAYYDATKSLVYDPFYVHLIDYLNKGLHFHPISMDVIKEIKDEMYAEFVTAEGDLLAITKNILPNVSLDHPTFIAKVPNPHLDETTGKCHYIISEEFINELGSRYMTIYTLFAILTFENEN